MNHKENVTSNTKDGDDDFYRVEASSKRDLDACATTEMTGLIPSAPGSEAELESYKALYAFSPDEYVE